MLYFNLENKRVPFTKIARAYLDNDYYRKIAVDSNGKLYMDYNFHNDYDTPLIPRQMLFDDELDELYQDWFNYDMYLDNERSPKRERVKNLADYLREAVAVVLKEK